MADWALIVARFLLYADLGLLFGMPLFGLYALRGDDRADLVRFRPLLAILALTGIGVNMLGFGLVTAAMSGTDLRAIDRNTLAMLLSETAVGWAFGIREIMLVAILVPLALARNAMVALHSLVSAFAAVAIGTLAWSGHGAGTGGTTGLLHLFADIVHLLAASAWIGALAMFVMLLWPADAVKHALATHRALARFATIGSIIVGLIMLTGIINGLFLVGIDQLPQVPAGPWGRLMLAKIGLFVAMLVMAAANRFRLTPRLEQAIASGNAAQPLSILRRILLLETVMAAGILGLVAWIGTLAPIATG